MTSLKVCFAVLALSLSVQAETTVKATDADKRFAKNLYERMTGVKVSASKVELQKVIELVAIGDKAAAAKYITTTPDFLNVQVKNFSIRLSNKDNSVNVGFNDFAALVAGVVRDNKDFREILTADYYYDITGVANENDLRTRTFNQTNFTPVETSYLDLTKALMYRPRQQLVTVARDTAYTQSERSYTMVETANNPDPAGVFTTRTFAERALSGGTNRRGVDYTMNQFLCVTMAEAADSNASDQYIGRDVERFPGGDYNKFLTSCKSCHSVMDGMRPAFGKLDYTNFSNGAATSTYSQMNGSFYNDQKVATAYSAYITDVFNANAAVVVPDLEKNQENSMYYKARYEFLVARGATDASARSTLLAILNTVRDPKIATQLISEFRVKKASVITDIRANVANATYKTAYTATCLNNLTKKNMTAQVQEENFLLCNLNAAKDMSLVYAYYDSAMTASGTSAAEKDRLLGKLVNKGRLATVNMMPAYLQAKELSKFYPRSSFDSETGIATKLNKGSYAYGFVVKSDSFVNNATLGSKSSFFGWRGGNKDGGKGIKEFGKMVSESRRFSQCMAKKVYEGVCGKTLGTTQYSTLVRLGDRFEALNYNLKSLYSDIALDPVCGLVKE